MIILYKSIYGQKLNDQILKRVYRLGRQRIMIYCIFQNDIIIEKLIKQKRKKKFNFQKNIFIKMQKKNKINVIVEDNVEISFVEEISIVISKII